VSAMGAGAPVSNCRALVGCQHTQPLADLGLDFANGHAFGDSWPPPQPLDWPAPAGIVGNQRGGAKGEASGGRSATACP
jgi:hypothetical protein